MTIGERLERLERLFEETVIEPGTVAEDAEANRQRLRHCTAIRRKLCDAYEGEYEVRVEWENGVIAIGIIKELTVLELRMAGRFLAYSLDGIIGVEPVEEAMKEPEEIAGIVLSDITGVEPTSETITGETTAATTQMPPGMRNYHHFAKAFEHAKNDMAKAFAHAGKQLSKAVHDINKTADDFEAADECEIEDETATSVDEIKETLCKARDMHFEATVVDNDLNSHTGTVSACGEDRFAFLSEGETRVIFYEDIQEVSLHPNFRKKTPGTWKPRADDVILLDAPRAEPGIEAGIEDQKWARYEGDNNANHILRVHPQRSDVFCTVYDIEGIEGAGDLITVAPELAKAALEYVNDMAGMSPGQERDHMIDMIRLLKRAGIENVASWHTGE